MNDLGLVKRISHHSTSHSQPQRAWFSFSAPSTNVYLPFGHPSSIQWEKWYRQRWSQSVPTLWYFYPWHRKWRSLCTRDPQPRRRKLNWFHEVGQFNTAWQTVGAFSSREVPALESYDGLQARETVTVTAQSAQSELCGRYSQMYICD